MSRRRPARHAGHRRDGAVISVLYKRYIYLNIYIHVLAISCVGGIHNYICVIITNECEYVNNYSATDTPIAQLLYVYLHLYYYFINLCMHNVNPTKPGC